LDAILSAAGLWSAVVLAGVYHGINPGMGWPLVVSAALMERRKGAFGRALGALAVGHFAAMLVILLPFAAMTVLVVWEREIRLAAGGLVIGLGLVLLANRRHPRFLARIPPARLMLWSFLVATAHGAGLMLVPLYLGLCAPGETAGGHLAAAELMARNAGLALGVALLHTGAMIASGGTVALAVHRWLGLRFLSRGWFNLDTVWALSLVGLGVLGVWTAL